MTRIARRGPEGKQMACPLNLQHVEPSTFCSWVPAWSSLPSTKMSLRNLWGWKHSRQPFATCYCYCVDRECPAILRCPFLFFFLQGTAVLNFMKGFAQGACIVMKQLEGPPACRLRGGRPRNSCRKSPPRRAGSVRIRGHRCVNDL